MHDTPASLRYHAVIFDLYGTLVDGSGRATPGALERVAECRGAKWAIVTSATQQLARYLLASAGIVVPEVLITGDDVARNKPAPDGYTTAVEKLGVICKRALAIEDTQSGIASARAAGLDVIAVLYGRRASFAASATFTVADLTKLRLRRREDAVDVTF